jgi:hypothetical protein
LGKRLIAVSAGVLAVTVVIMGCGGGDDDEATASSITKAEFIKQADAACEKGEKQMQVAFGAFSQEKQQEGVNKPTPELYDELVAAVVVPPIEQEADEIRALGAPDGDEEQIDAFVEAREESIEIAEGEPKAIISNSDVIFGKSSKLADAYGLENCAER